MEKKIPNPGTNSQKIFNETTKAMLQIIKYRGDWGTMNHGVLRDSGLSEQADQNRPEITDYHHLVTHIYIIWDGTY